MKRLALNRRVFMTQSASVAAAGAAFAANADAASVHPEIEHWEAELGARFQVGNKTLLLRKVTVKDYSADRARPRHLRPHTIQLTFVAEGRGKSGGDRSDLRLQHRSEQILLTPTVPPEGHSGEFYEGVIN